MITTIDSLHMCAPYTLAKLGSFKVYTGVSLDDCEKKIFFFKLYLLYLAPLAITWLASVEHAHYRLIAHHRSFLVCGGGGQNRQAKHGVVRFSEGRGVGEGWWWWWWWRTIMAGSCEWHVRRAMTQSA